MLEKIGGYELILKLSSAGTDRCSHETEWFPKNGPFLEEKNIFQNRRSFLAVLAIAFTLFANAFSQADAFAGGGDKEPKIEGSLVSISGRSVSIRLKNGTTRGVEVPVTAKIERDNARAALSVFKVGDRVQATFAATGTTVIKFEGVGL